MADITFNCPSCKQSLEAPLEMSGNIVECPLCKRRIKVPPAAPPQTSTDSFQQSRQSVPTPTPAAPSVTAVPITFGFERVVFGITRVFALLGSAVVLLSIVLLVFCLLSAGTGTSVTYEEVRAQSSPPLQETGESGFPNETAVSVQVTIPKVLKPYFDGKNSTVLSNWIDGLSKSQQRDFLDNLVVIVTKAKAAGADVEEAINTYKPLKLNKLQGSELEQYRQMAIKAGYAAGIIGLLLILSILSLILVMLAIERNTRPQRP